VADHDPAAGGPCQPKAAVPAQSLAWLRSHTIERCHRKAPAHVDAAGPMRSE
jgi:hypothetical protein